MGKRNKRGRKGPARSAGSGPLEVKKIGNVGSSDPIVARLAMTGMNFIGRAVADNVRKGKFQEYLLNLALGLADARKISIQIDRVRSLPTSESTTQRLTKLCVLFSNRLLESTEQARSLEGLFKLENPTEQYTRILQCAKELECQTPEMIANASLVHLEKLVDRLFSAIEDTLVNFVRPRLGPLIVMLEIPEGQRDPAVPARYELFVNPHLPLELAEATAKEVGLPILGKPSASGAGRGIIHTKFQGQTLLTIGSRIHYSPDWNTFPDFLNDYLKICFGKEFWEREVAKRAEERHPVLKMAADKSAAERRLFKRSADGLYYVDEPNGAMMAYLTLSYDLYTVNHNASLQKRLLERLRLADQNFHGARYELAVAASFARAGFDIRFFKEDGSSGSQPEFEARDRESGQTFCVEAKRRNREKVTVGEGWEARIDLGVDSLIRGALSKPHDSPLIVFVDLNLPPVSRGMHHSPVMEKIQAVVEAPCCKDEAGGQRFGALVFTSYPTEYAEERTPQFQFVLAAAGASELSTPMQQSFHALAASLSTYGKIPNWFHE